MKSLPGEDSFVGLASRGHFKPREAERLARLLQALEGKLVRVTVKPVRPTRSGKQNRYYWGCVLRYIADVTGLTNEEAHDNMRRMFLTSVREVILEDGTMVPLYFMRSTKSLSTAEFEDYLEDVRMWAGAELRIAIPLPHQVDLDAIDIPYRVL